MSCNRILFHFYWRFKPSQYLILLLPPLFVKVPRFFSPIFFFDVFPHSSALLSPVHPPTPPPGLVKPPRPLIDRWQIGVELPFLQPVIKAKSSLRQLNLKYWSSLAQEHKNCKSSDPELQAFMKLRWYFKVGLPVNVCMRSVFSCFSSVHN